MNEVEEFNREVVLTYDLSGKSIREILDTSGSLRDCLLLVLREKDFEQPFVKVECCWVSQHDSRQFSSAKLIVRGQAVGQLKALLDHRRFFTFKELRDQVGLAALFIGRRRDYRELLKLARDPQLVKRILLRSNELSALQAFSGSSQVLRAVRTDPDYSTIVTTDEEQFALFALQSLFNELQREFPPDIEYIEATFEIAPQKLLQVRMAYGTVLGTLQPMTVIIGPNGVGKTRLLLGLSKAVLGRRGTKLIVRNQDGVEEHSLLALVSFTYEKHIWTGLARSGASIVPLGVASSNWRAFTSVLRELALDKRLASFNLSALHSVMTEVANLDHVYLPTLVRTAQDAGHPQHSIPLTTLRDSVELSIVSALDLTKEAYFWSADLGTYRISSGQKSVLLFAASLFQQTARGALVLIDEPENHLHPRFVSILMQVLKKVLIATESRAVVVTHSPYVVREVDKNAILIMQHDSNGDPALYKTSMQTLGADVSSISDHVFLDTDIRKDYEHQIDVMLSQARGARERREVIEEVEASVGRDGEMYIRMKTIGKLQN